MSTAVLAADDPVIVTESEIDPLNAVAREMLLASQAEGDCRKGETAMDATTCGTANFVSRLVYSTFYFASYGVVFPTLFVASTVPGLGQAACGMVDGANAASEAVKERKAQRAERKAVRAAKEPAAHHPDAQGIAQERADAMSST
jgi:hypothetical protein